MTRSIANSILGVILSLFFFTQCSAPYGPYNNPKDPAYSSSPRSITAFGFASPSAIGVISGTSIAVTVPYQTDITALVASFTTTGSSVKVGPTIQTSGTTANNFASPVQYIVTAANGMTQTYTVTVTIGPQPGTTWTVRTLPNSTDWVPATYRSVTYGNNLFVAVGSSSYSENGSNGKRGFAATSPDGINWTPRTISSVAAWSSVTYGNGIFVAVGSDDLVSNTAVARSTDGITWTTGTLPSSAEWTAVTYGNGVFVAVTEYSTGTAATSSDGITWTLRALPASPSYSFWDSVTYGNGIFVTIDGNNGRVATSPSGATWTARTQFNWGAIVAYGGGVFVAVPCFSGTASATSSDGITWTSRSFLGSGNWNAVTFGNGLFVAMSGIVVATSPDGITWTSRTLPTSASWTSVTYGNGCFVAVSNSTVAVTSP